MGGRGRAEFAGAEAKSRGGSTGSAPGASGGFVCYRIRRCWDAPGEDQQGFAGAGGLRVGGTRWRWGGTGMEGSGRETGGTPQSSTRTLPALSIPRHLPVPPPQISAPCPHLSPRSSCAFVSPPCAAPLPSPSAPLTPGTSPGDKGLKPDPGFIESLLFSRLIPPCPPFPATGRGGPRGRGVGGRLPLNC